MKSAPAVPGKVAQCAVLAAVCKFYLAPNEPTAQTSGASEAQLRVVHDVQYRAAATMVKSARPSMQELLLYFLSPVAPVRRTVLDRYDDAPRLANLPTASEGNTRRSSHSEY